MVKNTLIEEALKLLNIELAAKEADEAIGSFKESIEELELCAEGSASIFDYESAVTCYDIIIQKCEKMDINILIIADYNDDASKITLKNGKYNKALEYGRKAHEIRKKKLEL